MTTAIMRTACAAAFATLALTGSARAESVSLNGQFPADYPEVSLLRRLSVDRIAGRDGPQLALALERALAGVRYDGAPLFDVVAGGNVDGVIDGVASTSVDTFDVDQQRERCTENDKDGKCIKRAQVNIRCRKRVIETSIDLRIVRTRDGKILYSNARPNRSEAISCPDGGSLASVEQIVRDTIGNTAAAVAHEIAPYSQRYEIRFYETRDRMTKDIGQRFKTAIKQTKSDLPGACQAFADIDRDFPDQIAVVYDLGICAEARGDYEAANALYRRAADIRPRDRADFDSGIDRTSRLIRARQDAVALSRRR